MGCDMVNAILDLNKAVEAYESDKNGKNKIELETAKHKFRECIERAILRGNDADTVVFSLFTAVEDLLREGTVIHSKTLKIAEDTLKEVVKNYVEYGYTAVFKMLKKSLELHR